MKLWQQIFLGMALGVAAGFFLKEDIEYVKPLGDIFISMIKMIIVPLIFFSISASITSMEKSDKLGRVGGISILLYMFSTIIAIIIGLTLANIFHPAQGVESGNMFGFAPPKQPDNISMADMITSMIPNNPVKAMAEGNVLQIIIFAFFLGTAVKLTGKRANKISDAINDMAEIMYSLTAIVMKFAPIGVFALIGWVVGTQDPLVLQSLVRLVVIVIAACVTHMIVTYSAILIFVARVNPVTFFRKIIDAQLLAFSTSSSSATLPVTIRVAKEKLGVSKDTASFVLPLGSTVNMDGTAIYLGISAIFVAGLIGHDLTMSNYITIILTTTLSSIGAAGIPGVALIVMSIVFTAIGLPIEAIAIIAGVDRMLDMVRTTINVTGDLTVSVAVDRLAGNFDKKLYDKANIHFSEIPVSKS